MERATYNWTGNWFNTNNFVVEKIVGGKVVASIHFWPWTSYEARCYFTDEKGEGRWLYGERTAQRCGLSRDARDYSPELDVVDRQPTREIKYRTLEIMLERESERNASPSRPEAAVPA